MSPVYDTYLSSFIFILLNQLDPIFSDIEAPNEQNHIEHH